MKRHSNIFLQLVLMFFVVSFLCYQHSITPLVAGQSTQEIFYEDFSEATLGTVGDKLLKEGGTENHWGAVSAGEGNVLKSDYANYLPYLADVNNSVVSNVSIDLSVPSVSSEMIFNISCDTEPRVGEAWKDYVALSVYNGSTWIEIGRYDETSLEGEDYQYIVENLSAYTNSDFKFKFTWITDGANSTYSGCAIWPIVITQTTESATLLAPSNVSLTSNSSTQLTASWTHNSTVDVVYNVYLALTQSGDCSSQEYPGLPDYTTATNATLQVATGLSINRRYCAKVVAFDGVSTTEPAYTSIPKYTFANQPNAPTVSDTELGTELNLIIDTNGNTGLTEYAIACDGDTKFINHATSACETIVDNDNFWRTYGDWGSYIGFDIAGLTPDTSYTYKVVARNGGSVETTLSDASSEYTLASIPLSPTVNNTTATSSLTVIINQNYNPTGTTYAIYETSTYKFVQADGSLDTDAVWGTYADRGGASGITVTGLSANTQYHFKTKAKNFEDTQTDLSDASSKFTLIEAPVGVTFGTVYNASIELILAIAPSNLSVGLSGLQFVETSGHAGGGGEDGFTSWTKANNVTDSGLSQNTRYSYKVKARNGDGTPTTDSSPAEQTTGNYQPPSLAPITSNGTEILDNYIDIAYQNNGEAKSQRFSGLQLGANSLQILERNPGDPTVFSTLNFTIIYKQPLNLSTQNFSTSWNMVSFPDLSAAITNGTLLPGTFKLRRYDGASNSYKKGEIENTTLTPGAGYWLKVDDTNKINGLRYALNQTSSTEIGVTKGWNLLGNPYQSDLPLSNLVVRYKNGATRSYADAINREEVSGYGWIWEGSSKQYFFVAINPSKYKTSAHKQTIINPFRGFWMIVRSDQISSIILNK